MPTAQTRRRPSDSPWRRTERLKISLSGKQLDFLTEEAERDGLAVSAMARCLMTAPMIRDGIAQRRGIFDTSCIDMNAQPGRKRPRDAPRARQLTVWVDVRERALVAKFAAHFDLALGAAGRRLLVTELYGRRLKTGRTVFNDY